MLRLRQRSLPILKRSFHLIFFLHVLIVFPDVVGEMFILLAKGHRLIDSQIKEIDASSAAECIQICLTDGPHCKSINYWVTSGGKGRCGLNHRVYEVWQSEKLVADGTSSFWQRSQMNCKNKPEYIANEPNTTTPSCNCRNKDECSKAGKCLDNFALFQLKKIQDGSPCVTDKNCAEVYSRGERKDGVYVIDPDGQGSFEVRCDMTTEGGGWTVFQRRINGGVDFYRDWVDYKRGFGDLTGEFWLGLEKINRLTKKSGGSILRIDLEDFNSRKRHATYSSFSVAGESDKFKLVVGTYSGNAGDSLTYHNGMYFTTRDMDNDRSAQGKCALKFKGAWWYRHCHQSNINGMYHGGYHASYADGINWHAWKGHHYSLKKTEMKTKVLF